MIDLITLETKSYGIFTDNPKITFFFLLLLLVKNFEEWYES